MDSDANDLESTWSLGIQMGPNLQSMADPGKIFRAASKISGGGGENFQKIKGGKGEILCVFPGRGRN